MHEATRIIIYMMVLCAVVVFTRAVCTSITSIDRVRTDAFGREISIHSDISGFLGTAPPTTIPI
ncbi:MAG: hypothetical protein V1862_10350 [Methanobacteriota archaeon]